MTLQFIFCAVTSSVARVDQNVFHVLCAELKRQTRFACFFLLGSPVAPNGILVEGGTDKREADCAPCPMPRSHFSLNLHQALFRGQGKNYMSHPWRGTFTVNLLCYG